VRQGRSSAQAASGARSHHQGHSPEGGSGGMGGRVYHLHVFAAANTQHQSAGAQRPEGGAAGSSHLALLEDVEEIDSATCMQT
jgi:hypothetical protein